MKKLSIILTVALILCLMVGCQDKEAMAELEEFRAQAEIEKQNEALYRGIIEEINKGNSEYFNEFYSPDSLYYFPSNNPKPLSREQHIVGTKMSYRAFPDMNQSIEELFAVGDRVIVRSIATFTHEEEFRGIPATGNKFEVSSISILQIKNGKIIEVRVDMDMLGMMQQLGFELKPKEGEK